MYAARPPAEPGTPVEEVDTPALLIDLDAFERNLARMAEETKAAGINLRPHAKAHKCAPVGIQQMALGAVGLCCQSVTEAEAMAHGGIPDVFVSNIVVEISKLRRLAALARRARVAICVDSKANIEDINAVAESFDVELRVLIELDAGTERCGIEPGAPAAALAKAIDESRNLTFGGIQAYHGISQHDRTVGERQAATDSMVARINETKTALAAAGLACDTVTGGGTGTYPLEMASGVYTEVQPGSYIFMDVDYAKNKNADGSPYDSFDQSLFVYATVISRPARTRAMTNAGTKAISVDSGPPSVRGMSGFDYVMKGDEHGLIRLPDSGSSLMPGSKVLLIPGHCDPTVNLYDHFVGIRNGWVETVWPIAARGPGR